MTPRPPLLLAVTLLIPVAVALADNAKTPRTADAILNQYCNVCHATGWNGAPLSGDPNDWQPRLAAGFDTLFKNVKQGINTMPPMGTCTDCTDEELEAAIRKMLP
jgi:cytochrome c5